ncbi:MAG: hypothetical protein V3U96_00150 [Paracoccaceae bacterium]
MQPTMLIALPGGRECTAGVTLGQSRELAVILPGLNYGCERPLLAGVTGLLQAQGADIVALNFSYNTDTEFLAMPDAAKLARIKEDGSAIVEHCLGLSDYRSLTVVGKSLGTVSMAGLAGHNLPDKTRMIWLTPSLTGTGLLAAMAGFDCPMYSVIGSCDLSVEITRGADYQNIAGLSHLEVAGMDHGWEHVDGMQAAQAGLAQAMVGLRDWM